MGGRAGGRMVRRSFSFRCREQSCDTGDAGRWILHCGLRLLHPSFSDNRWHGTAGTYAAKADVVLLHIGTNDILQNAYASPQAAADDMGGKMAELLAVVRSFNPGALIYVASLISFSPTSEHAAFNSQVAAYNSVLPFVLEGEPIDTCSRPPPACPPFPPHTCALPRLLHSQTAGGAEVGAATRVPVRVAFVLRYMLTFVLTCTILDDVLLERVCGGWRQGSVCRHG